MELHLQLHVELHMELPMELHMELHMEPHMEPHMELASPRGPRAIPGCPGASPGVLEGLWGMLGLSGALLGGLGIPKVIPGPYLTVPGKIRNH